VLAQGAILDVMLQGAGPQDYEPKVLGYCRCYLAISRSEILYGDEMTERGGLVHRLRPVIVLKTEAFLITGLGGSESMALLSCYE
jgi:hypothetical protein